MSGSGGQYQIIGLSDCTDNINSDPVASKLLLISRPAEGRRLS